MTKIEVISRLIDAKIELAFLEVLHEPAMPVMSEVKRINELYDEIELCSKEIEENGLDKRFEL